MDILLTLSSMKAWECKVSFSYIYIVWFLKIPCLSYISFQLLLQTEKSFHILIFSFYIEPFWCINLTCLPKSIVDKFQNSIIMIISCYMKHIVSLSWFFSIAILVYCAHGLLLKCFTPGFDIWIGRLLVGEEYMDSWPAIGKVWRYNFQNITEECKENNYEVSGLCLVYENAAWRGSPVYFWRQGTFGRRYGEACLY